MICNLSMTPLLNLGALPFLMPLPLLIPESSEDRLQHCLITDAIVPEVRKNMLNLSSKIQASLESGVTGVDEGHDGQDAAELGDHVGFSSAYFISREVVQNHRGFRAS